MKRNYRCEILENVEITENIHRIRVIPPKEASDIKAGQFFNIKCGEGSLPLLRRPISVGLNDEESLNFYVRKAGEGTKLLCERKVGTFIDLLGPLGNGFDLNIKKGKALVIGGGIGVAPLLELVKSLGKMDDIYVKAMLGFKDTPFLIEEFKNFTGDIVAASEKKKLDYRGYITDLIKKEIEDKEYTNIFACGPKPMLHLVKKISDEFDVPSQLLMEERMACGIGACLVCNCKVKSDEDGWTYVRACKDGPVFKGEEVIFDE